METVHFTIYRKRAFAGALLPYNIYINGQFVGTIKNGKTLNADVPKADVYYIEDDNTFERNAVIYDKNVSEYKIILKRAGGWQTASYNEFYIDNGNKKEPIPSFHFDKFAEAAFLSGIDELPPDERRLALYLKSWDEIPSNAEEILMSNHFDEIIDALKEIGAKKFVNLFSNIINEFFPDVTLPLSYKQCRQMRDRINDANKMIRNNEKSTWDELRYIMVKHITSTLINEENVY